MFVELVFNTKVPKRGEDGSWNRSEEAGEFLSRGSNVGKLLPDLVVVDFDDKEKAREWYKIHHRIISTIVETRRGAHFYFFGTTQQRKYPSTDIKHGANSYCVAPPSVVNQFRYKIVQAGILQPFPEELFPIERKEIAQREPIDENDPVRTVIRARAWVAKREKREDGNGRGLQTIKTCRALFQMFGLTEEQVWPLILEYNERCCIPPYSEKQLRHKIEDSQKSL